MRDLRLSHDDASLTFKYCDEHPDFNIKQFAKLVEKKTKSRVILKKNRLGRPKKESKMIKLFKFRELISAKHQPS